MSRFEAHALIYGGFGPVSFILTAGERIGVSGPSGCGKTRLLRALADLDPWEGRLNLDGVAAEAVRPCDWRRRVAYVPAESQWWHDTVGAHFPRRPDEADLLALALAPDALDWPVSRLSSGEKQRLGLLRALANTPDVLLLDEPTAHLDAARTEAVEALVRARCDARGLMAVWVAHDAAQLRRMAPSRGYRMAARGAWEKTTWT